MDGILVVWKPIGISSFGVVSKIRKLSNTKRVGHGGTLDPLAEGVLVLALGKATRVLEYMQGSYKTYQAEATLGTTTTTYDSEGEPTPVNNRQPGIEEIQQALQSFEGESLQIPPAFSALHVEGQRAYALARKGEVVNLPARPVTMTDLKLISYEYPHVRFRVHVSGGTYIRSLVHDLGQQLGCGAYMSALTRTEAGTCTQEQAHTLEEITEQGVESLLLPVATSMLKLPVLQITVDTLQNLQQGKRLPGWNTTEDGIYQLSTHQLCEGIVEVRAGVLHPKKIF